MSHKPGTPDWEISIFSYFVSPSICELASGKEIERRREKVHWDEKRGGVVDWDSLLRRKNLPALSRLPKEKLHRRRK